MPASAISMSTASTAAGTFIQALPSLSGGTGFQTLQQQINTAAAAVLAVGCFSVGACEQFQHLTLKECSNNCYWQSFKQATATSIATEMAGCVANANQPSHRLTTV
jgi:hypothetical protein